MTLETHPPQKSAGPGARRNPSLRLRIILAISFTSIIAALSIGLLANIRSLGSQAFLGEKLQNEVKENSESQIRALAVLEAQSIDRFFQNIDSSIVSIANYTQNLIAQEDLLSDGKYWDAKPRLTRLPNGAWDNANTDVAAIFAPESFVLAETDIRELNSVIHLDFIAPDVIRNNPNIVAMYYGNNSNVTIYYPNIDLASLVPPNFEVTGRTWYVNAKNSLYGNTKVVWSEPYLDAALNGLVVTGSIPVVDNSDKIRGVLGADIKIASITDRVQQIKIGESGFAFLIDTNGLVLATPDEGNAKFGFTPEAAAQQPNILKLGPAGLQPVFMGMVRGETGLTRVQLQGVNHYLAFAPIPSTGYSLGLIVPVSEMDIAYQEALSTTARENQATRNFGLALLAAVVGIALLIGAGTGQWLTNPLDLLTRTVQKITAGDLAARAPEISSDEIGILARAFNNMTAQLRETLDNLESRVSERTTELAAANERVQRRVAQFEAIAQTARAISNTQDLETLLPRIANVISRYFGFYHIGIFLLDEDKAFAVLRASNSEGGKRMIERGHQLKVGEVGIVGFVTSRGQPRIALDTGADIVHFKNPDLPDTRSELALPLRIADQIIGALDVQSTEPSAFSNEDINVLTILADQVSTAIQNARLYEQTRTALAESQILYRKFIQSGWRQYTMTKKLSGIRYAKGSADLLDTPKSFGENGADGLITLPISIRGEKIGEIHMQPPEDRRWGTDDLEIARALVERAAIAMENVRLLDDAQRRAAREQAIGEISANISTTSDIESILRIAVEELGRTMGGAEVILELGVDKEGDSQ